MKVLVCGGRGYFNAEKVNKTLDELNEEKKITVIIHGGATGADALAEKWAESRFVRPHRFPIFKEDWKKYGKAAGPLRNTRMLLLGKPDLVVAFPGHDGTNDMIKQATNAGVEVRRFK